MGPGSKVMFGPVSLVCSECGSDSVPTSDCHDGAYGPGEKVIVTA
jgi:hypothetical protein